MTTEPWASYDAAATASRVVVRELRTLEELHDAAAVLGGPRVEHLGVGVPTVRAVHLDSSRGRPGDRSGDSLWVGLWIAVGN